MTSAPFPVILRALPGAVVRRRSRAMARVAPGAPLAAFLAALLALLVALLMPAPAAAAPSLQHAGNAVTACGPGGLGDRLVPDRGPWFDFAAACAEHDACYAARLGQIRCDAGFRAAMLAHCSVRRWCQRAACRDTAGLYSEAVRRFGHLLP